MLLRARKLCPHGRWGAWLDEEHSLSDATAAVYMEVAENWEAVREARSLNEARRVLKEMNEQVGDTAEGENEESGNGESLVVEAGGGAGGEAGRATASGSDGDSDSSAVRPRRQKVKAARDAVRASVIITVYEKVRKDVEHLNSIWMKSPEGQTAKAIRHCVKALQGLYEKALGGTGSEG